MAKRKEAREATNRDITSGNLDNQMDNEPEEEREEDEE